MRVMIKDLKPGQYIQGADPDNILKVENAVKVPEGISLRFSLHGNLTDFRTYGAYDTFEAVTLH